MKHRNRPDRPVPILTQTPFLSMKNCTNLLTGKEPDDKVDKLCAAMILANEVLRGMVKACRRSETLRRRRSGRD